MLANFRGQMCDVSDVRTDAKRYSKCARHFLLHKNKNYKIDIKHWLSGALPLNTDDDDAKCCGIEIRREYIING